MQNNAPTGSLIGSNFKSNLLISKAALKQLFFTNTSTNLCNAKNNTSGAETLTPP